MVKVLATKLGLVMDILISLNQSTFIKGKLLVDGVIAVNEVIYLTKKTKRVCPIFKLNFGKVNDSPSWSFLYYILIIVESND